MYGNIPVGVEDLREPMKPRSDLVKPHRQLVARNQVVEGEVEPKKARAR